MITVIYGFLIFACFFVFLSSPYDHIEQYQFDQFYFGVEIVTPIISLIYIIIVLCKHRHYKNGYKYRNYAITNKSILLSYGFKGYGFSKLAFRHIQFANVACQYHDRRNGTYAGTIFFKTPSANLTFYMINDVNNAFQEIQEIINKSKNKKNKFNNKWY